MLWYLGVSHRALDYRRYRHSLSTPLLFEADPRHLPPTLSSPRGHNFCPITAESVVFIYCAFQVWVLMSSRITRSAARLAADSPPSVESGPSSSPPAAGSAPSRKRKAPARRDRSPDSAERPKPQSPHRKSKRQRRVTSPRATNLAAASRRGTRNRPAMSHPGYVEPFLHQQRMCTDLTPPRSPSSHPAEESSKKPASPPQQRRKSSRHGKVSQGKTSRNITFFHFRNSWELKLWTTQNVL